MKKIGRWVKNQRGFTLVEAIVTVAIVGMLVVPISTLFKGSLDRVIETKIKLETTQLAQLYLENIKMKTSIELMDFFTVKTGRILSQNITSVTDFSYGFPKLPDGYTAEIIVDKEPFVIGTTTYADPIPATRDFDFEITFLANNKDFEIANTTNINSVYDSTTGDRKLYIYCKRDLSVTDPIITIGNGPTSQFTIDQDILSVGLDQILTIKLNCDLNLVNTYIYTDNDFENPIRIYYEQTNSTPILDYVIEKPVSPNEGSMGKKTNMIKIGPKLVDDIPQIVYKVTVKITGPYGVMSELTTTKIDK